MKQTNGKKLKQEIATLIARLEYIDELCEKYEESEVSPNTYDMLMQNLRIINMCISHAADCIK